VTTELGAAEIHDVFMRFEPFLSVWTCERNCTATAAYGQTRRLILIDIFMSGTVDKRKRRRRSKGERGREKEIHIVVGGVCVAAPAAAFVYWRGKAECCGDASLSG
jgi:hypothetical protein